MSKNDIHVIPHNDQWATKKECAKRVGSVADTKAEATEKARKQAEREHVEVVIHGKDGRVQDSDSYGNDPRGSKDTKH